MELNLAEADVNRLQTVGLRFCGIADQALPRVWRIEKHVVIDALIAPTESYHRDLFFQQSSSPGGVGTSLALETIIHHSSTDFRPARNEGSISVLVCSRGEGGLLEQRMELVAELWDENIKYEYASEHDIKGLINVKDLIIETDTGGVSNWFC
ncbi:hypothetical protein RJ641_021886 [Dillenia turbinata]|uniref:Uncharacterized protein n=1 Tax=Dillenia turbinata TaxID=194707 RepID=A0AAN8YW67_9MAGN